MSEELEPVEDVIDDIYQAAVGQDAWSACLDILFKATGATGAVFCSLHDPVNRIVSDSLRQADKLYRDRWWRDDAFLTLVLAQPPKPGLLLDDAFDNRIDRERHPFFRDFLRGCGFDRFAVYVSPDLFGARFMLIAYRAVNSGPYAPEQLRRLGRLAPHVARALAITGQLSLARSRDDALMSILDKMSYGAMIVGANGRVHASNDTALSMLGDGLALQDGRLTETFINARGLVDGLFKVAAGDDGGKSNSALLHRPSGRKPIVLQALNFPTNLPWHGVERSDAALLMLIDTESPASASQLSVVQSFGLTSAEARVATIVGAGFSPVEAAEQLGSAAGTVRTQLKNVFNKLDLKRQSELVRLMTKLEVLGG